MVAGKLTERVLLVAVALTLVGLAFMMWGLFGRGPIPIFLSMTLGQGVGTLAFLLYLVVIVMEFWQSHAPPAQTSPPEPAADAEPAGENERDGDA